MLITDYTPNNTTQPKVGDILYATHNYDACIPIWYKVIGLKGKASIVLCRLMSDEEYTKPMEWIDHPTKVEIIDDNGKSSIVRRFKTTPLGYYVPSSGNKKCMYQWNGKPFHAYNVH